MRAESAGSCRIFFTSLFLLSGMASECADSQPSGAGVSSDAHSQRRINEFHIGVILLHLRPECFQCFFIHGGIGNSDF